MNVKELIGRKVKLTGLGAWAVESANTMGMLDGYTGTIVGDSQDGDVCVAINEEVHTYHRDIFSGSRSDKPNLIVLDSDCYEFL